LRTGRKMMMTTSAFNYKYDYLLGAFGRTGLGLRAGRISVGH
jgi:hypothetical protein